ncbi:MAG: hypothetical protein EOP90_05360 [Lysobacteraceae bacterium]|nr:MAG: hypothetical protein EOP90_05360 [Xanthomonadaceae bacterium]
MTLIALSGMGTMGDARAGAPVFWVGAAAPCNFNSLQTAIGAVPDGAEIRLATNQAYDNVNVVVGDKSLLISGGWGDCSDDAADGVTELVGDPLLVLPVLAIGSPATAREVVLRRLHVRGGRRSGIELSGHVELRVERSTVDANEAQVGGGIRVVGVSQEDTVLRVVESMVGNATGADGNLADYGGGIACANAHVRLGGSAIIGNQAASEGGGLYLDGCALDTSPNVYAFDGIGSLSLWIASNTAAINGGGIAAVGASTLEFHAPVAPYAIHANHANEGGGLLLRNPGTALQARGLVLSDNVATDRGGAASLQDGAQFTMQRLLPVVAGGGVVATSCGLAAACNVVSGNRAETYTGGAFYVSQGSLALRQVLLDDNYSANGSVLLLYDGTVRIENSLLRGNDAGSGALVRMLDDSSFVLNSSTVAGNTTGASLFELFSEGGANNLHFRNSIIWQPDTTVVVPTPVDVVSGACLNAHEQASIDALVHDPGFVDAAAGDYRLHAASPNVDACADPFAGPVADLLGRERPTDLGPDHGEGDFDRGAYELGDRIFADGFEGIWSPIGAAQRGTRRPVAGLAQDR